MQVHVRNSPYKTSNRGKQDYSTNIVSNANGVLLGRVKARTIVIVIQNRCFSICVSAEAHPPGLNSFEGQLYIHMQQLRFMHHCF